MVMRRASLSDPLSGADDFINLIFEPSQLFRVRHCAVPAAKIVKNGFCFAVYSDGSSRGWIVGQDADTAVFSPFVSWLQRKVFCFVELRDQLTHLLGSNLRPDDTCHPHKLTAAEYHSAVGGNSYLIVWADAFAAERGSVKGDKRVGWDA